MWTSDCKYHATADAVAELIEGGGEFLAPTNLLRDLTAEQATTPIPYSPYTIAQVVYHLHFWQERQIAYQRTRQGETRPEHLDDTFAPVAPAEWPALRTAFLEGLQQVVELARAQETAVSPARDDTSVGYDLAESALHNAYHLGQIALLRQMQGYWPPQGGDDSW